MSALSVTWTALSALTGLLTVGISWSYVRRRLAGQVDVDDVSK
ncbi:MAG: DUF6524 family protein [Gammaproteobacteria bacterium]